MYEKIKLKTEKAISTLNAFEKCVGQKYDIVEFIKTSRQEITEVLEQINSAHVFLPDLLNRVNDVINQVHICAMEPAIHFKSL